jgi:hypothetical protein
MKTLISIDPGAGGGMAIRFPDDVPITTFGFETLTEGDIIDRMRSVKAASKGECIAILEDIQRFSPQPAAMMSVYAESFGVIKGALMTLGYRVVKVRSQTWQKALSLVPVKHPKMKGGEPVMKNGKPVMEKKAAEWKRTLKARAQELFPDVEVTLQNADALLLIEWARKTGVA